MAENKSSISQADSYEAIGEYWDAHDFTQFDDPQRPDVHFEIQDTVRIEAGLLNKLEKAAAERGISTETLVNLWLLERVQSNTVA
jgi:predicted HicB family RNase H-like nuclease